MTLIYSGLVSSLRETSALAASLGDFDINDTSVRYRLGNAVEFLTAILNHVLFGSAKNLADKGIRRRICLQDATVVTCASNKSSYFRLHTEYVPGQGLAYVQITDQHGAESLKYGHYQPGDIVIADQGLARARDFHHVHSTGAYSLIRTYLPNIRLLDAQDKRVEAVKVLNMVDAGIDSIPVWIPFEGNTPLPARLVVKKLPPEQAAQARVRAKKRMSKSQKGGSDLAIRLAGYGRIRPDTLYC